MLTSSVIALLVAALSATGSPVLVRDSVVTLPFAKRLNTTGTVNILKNDLARVAALRSRNSPSVFEQDSAVANAPITNEGVSYIASVGVGRPVTTFYNLIVDTGSANLWIGADPSHRFTPQSSSQKTSNSVSVTYGSGSVAGTEWIDTVTIGSLVVPNQPIGVASSSQGFSGVDGILGLGPSGLTIGTLFPATTAEALSVTDNAFAQGIIPADLVAISFAPTTSISSQNGELTFGGTDPSKFIAPITYTPVTSTSPSSEFWGINQSIKYGSTTILSSTAGIVDTGTSLLLIASDAFNKYKTAVGGTLDANTGLLKIPSANFAKLSNLTFTIGGTDFNLTPNAQIWPRSLSTAIGGSASNIYLIVNDIGAPSGSGLDFINGMVFLERFYSVYDTGNKRVGFANTPFTTATTN